ncbi:hypothetical protein AC579_9934 [Pseudocercospora musae]|uniref:non-specific serine/threonine protein kinase n=1 Tax=Pseudocercospora musae TaxID=113226 RepID=A0A139I0T3_9PEZI|nr:hypothetical protein AC579_9934 [Pseudocercospora musae]
MAPTTWNTFRNHHWNLAANWPGGATSKRKTREISAVWKSLLTPQAKRREVGSIRNDPSRTLAQSSSAAQRIVNDIPPPSPGPTYVPFLLRQDDRVINPDAVNQADTTGRAWVGGWSIGGRGSNRACPWYRVDDDDNVDDRRIVKDTYPIDPLDWIDATKWQGDAREDGLPMEYVLHKRLRGTNGGEHFADVEGCRVLARRWFYRFVMEYCDQKDAQDLKKRYALWREMVPEPFLWRLLESLALACKAMQDGALNAVVVGWQEIIHRDLKPDNVFLASEDGRLYPKPKVADFAEFAIETFPDDPFNPRIYREQRAGHVACAAPESLNRCHDSLEDDQLLSAANVWCIGITMWYMMNNRHYDSGHDWWDADDYRDANQWDESPLNFYSQPLIDAVGTCLQFLPANRATPQGLLDRIAANAGIGRAGQCINARDAVSENDAGFNQADWHYISTEDEWRRPWADVLREQESIEGDIRARGIVDLY